MNHSHRAASHGAANSGSSPSKNVAKNEGESAGHPVLDNLLQLRDEIRLHMHLANMEGRDQWQRLEREIYSVTHLISTAKADRHVVLHELRLRVENFARRLGEPDAH